MGGVARAEVGNQDGKPDASDDETVKVVLDDGRFDGVIRDDLKKRMMLVLGLHKGRRWKLPTL